MTITPEQFYDFLSQQIDKYGGDVANVIVTQTNKLAEPTKQEVQSYSVKDKQLYRTGDYKGGWRISTINKKNKGVYRKRIHQSSSGGKPTLVHLLEFGHEAPMVKAEAYPHVQPTEAKYCEKLFENIKKGINALWH